MDEIVKQPATIARAILLPRQRDGLDLPGLPELGKEHEVKFLKAMQCLNIPLNPPLGQGLWEGVPLREVLRLCGKLKNVGPRLYYWGFHNNDPKTTVPVLTELCPGDGRLLATCPLSSPTGSTAHRSRLGPGGPVRMVIPWAHGFKSIKWLRQIVLTNDFKANDTYAIANNDPESHLKTAAYLDDFADRVPAGQPVFLSGLAISGWSGLKRVEYWLRVSDDKAEELSDDDPAWKKASWIECRLDDPPADWDNVLPSGISSKEILGFDPKTGNPAVWPLRYSFVPWSASLEGLVPGRYELHVRAVDLNNFAQPEPRDECRIRSRSLHNKNLALHASRAASPASQLHLPCWGSRPGTVSGHSGRPLQC